MRAALPAMKQAKSNARLHMLNDIAKVENISKQFASKPKPILRIDVGEQRCRSSRNFQKPNVIQHNCLRAVSGEPLVFHLKRNLGSQFLFLVHPTFT
jgi:hypothetical protein